MAAPACLYRVQVQTDGGTVEFCGTFNELRKVITDPVLVQQLEGQVEQQQSSPAGDTELHELAGDTVELVEDHGTDVQDEDAVDNNGVFAIDGSVDRNGALINANLPADVANAGDVTGFQWPKRAVLQLIKLFVESVPLFESPAFTQKQVWKMIAEKLNSTECFVVTPLQVDTKWRGLKKTYKKVKEHNAVTGNVPRKWEFYSAMEEILERQQELVTERTPLVTFHGSTGIQLTSSTAISADDVPLPVTMELPSSRSAGRYSSFVKRRRMTSTAFAGQLPSEQPTADRLYPTDHFASTSSCDGADGREPMPDWIALLREDLEERRKIRQEERHKIVTLLDKIADKL